MTVIEVYRKKQERKTLLIPYLYICVIMEPTTSVVLSLRGFSSLTFGKTLTDFEISTAMKKLKFNHRKCPIFHVKAILEFSSTSALRKLLDWFANLCSDIHFCRLWYNNNHNSLDTPFTSTLQDLMITFDGELTMIEKKLEFYREDVCQGLLFPSELTVLRLYHSLRKYSPLFVSLVKMIDTYMSDLKYRRRCKRKSMQHPYHGCVGILSEIEILQQKASYSFGNSLIKRSHSIISSSQVGRRIPYSRETVLSLRLHLSSPQESLFGLFLRNLLPSFLEYTLSHVFQYTTKKISFSSSNDGFFNYSVKQLSSWTPNQMVLWAVTLLFEYCKVDFDVLSRFRNMPILKENRNDVVSTTNKQYDLCDDMRIANLFKLKHIDPLDGDVVDKDVVTEYLLTGKRKNATHGLNANMTSFTPVFADQHVMAVRAKAQVELQDQLLDKITNLLHFVLKQQQQQSSLSESITTSASTFSKLSTSEQLWKHSFDMYPPHVFHQLATLFDQVNNLKLSQKKQSINFREEQCSQIQKIDNNVSFIHHEEFIRRQIFAPLCDHLNLVKISAFQILAQEFRLKQHLQFISSVYLLNKIDLLQSFKELVLLLPIYHAAEAVVPYRQFSTQHTFQSQSQWQSLSFTLEHAILEHKPMKGVQHFSVTMPSLLEAHRHRMLNTRSSDNSITGKSGESVFDESLLGYLISNLRFELHYSWPVSMLFPGSYMQRLQTIFQSLLSMMTLKWLSEAWWKAIIPKGGLRQFRVLDRLRQCALDKQRKQQTHSQRFGDKEVVLPRQPGDILDEMDDQDTREEEERLKQAQKNCQQAFIQVMHLSQLLSGYYLSRIHERVWPDVVRKSSFNSEYDNEKSNINKEKIRRNMDAHDTTTTACTIEMVQIAIRDGLEFIEDLLSLIDQPMKKLMHSALKAFQELRQALAVEYGSNSSVENHGGGNDDEEEDEEDIVDLTGEDKDYYAELQRQAMQHTQTTLSVGKKQVQQNNKRKFSMQFSRKKLLKEIAAHRERVSRMLVAYRMAEIAFEDVNQAREAVMLAILSWRAGAASVSFSSSTTTTPTGKSSQYHSFKLNSSNASNNSAAERAKKVLARTPQSAWKMQQMQMDGKSWQRRAAAIKQTTKRLFEQESVMMAEDVDYHRWESMMVDEEGSDNEEEQPLQRAYGIDFLRCVEELQTQCTMLWTE